MPPKRAPAKRSAAKAGAAKRSVTRLPLPKNSAAAKAAAAPQIARAKRAAKRSARRLSAAQGGVTKRRVPKSAIAKQLTPAQVKREVERLQRTPTGVHPFDPGHRFIADTPEGHEKNRRHKLRQIDAEEAARQRAFVVDGDVRMMNRRAEIQPWFAAERARQRGIREPYSPNYHDRSTFGHRWAPPGSPPRPPRHR